MTHTEWHRLNPDIPMPYGIREPWVWHQPKDRAELLKRLAEARDMKVHERERENLCSCAFAWITEASRVMALAQADCTYDSEDAARHGLYGLSSAALIGISKILG